MVDRREYHEEYFNRPEVIARLNKMIKNKFIEMYGKKCSCPGCDEDNPNYMTLDHVQNDMNIRVKTGGHHDKEYRIAIKEYRPDIYQILCWNCNCGKHRNIDIPHTYI